MKLLFFIVWFWCFIQLTFGLSKCEVKTIKRKCLQQFPGQEFKVCFENISEKGCYKGICFEKSTKCPTEKVKTGS